MAPGNRYGYRISADGTTLGETWIDVPQSARLALAGVRPNPARGVVTASFSLPDDAPATLDLWDVIGRRIRSVSVGSFGPGDHQIRVGAPALRPGIYVLTLRHANELLTRRISIIR